MASNERNTCQLKMEHDKGSVDMLYDKVANILPQAKTTNHIGLKLKSRKSEYYLTSQYQEFQLVTPTIQPHVLQGKSTLTSKILWLGISIQSLCHPGSMSPRDRNKMFSRAT